MNGSEVTITVETAEKTLRLRASQYRGSVELEADLVTGTFDLRGYDLTPIEEQP